MNLKKMYRAIICGMIVLLLIAIGLLWSLNSLIDDSRNLNQDGIKLITLSNDMLHINDYLIKLMRVFILTGDEALLKEYRALLTYENLEGKLAKMAQIGLADEEKTYIYDLMMLLYKLAGIEARAIEAYEAGDPKLAASIIYSDEYSAADFLLANKTSALIASITDRVNTGVSDIQNQLQIMKALISMFLTLSISCLVALQIMQRNRILKPISEIEKAMSRLADDEAGIQIIKKHDDEIGSLIDHMNVITNRIEAYRLGSENSEYTESS